MRDKAQETQAILGEALKLLVEHLRASGEPATPVVEWHAPEDLEGRLDLALPEEGVGQEELLALVESYLRHSVRTTSPRFANQLFGGHDPPSLLGELVAAATNTSMYTYECAPAATLIERQLVADMGRLVGFEEGEGLFVNGGSAANLVAMLCARNVELPRAKEEGLAGAPLVALVSDQAHYSFQKAANVLGVGNANLLQVPSDERGRLRPERLEEAIVAARRAGRRPFFVGATAGTTVLGAFDPVPEIAAVAREHGLWLHVDGAWGGPALFSRRQRHLLEGSELASSFSWDAHKLMGVPLVCTALLVRERGTLFRTCSSGGTDYLFHDDHEDSWDTGSRSLACGRRADALKLWLAWKHHGTRGYERRVDRLVELAHLAARRVEAIPELELTAAPSFLNVCFRYRGPAGADPERVDALNVALRERLARSGAALLNYAHLRGRVTLRLVLGNAEMQAADVERLLVDCVSAGAAVLDESRARGRSAAHTAG